MAGESETTLMSIRIILWEIVILSFMSVLLAMVLTSQTYLEGALGHAGEAVIACACSNRAHAELHEFICSAQLRDPVWFRGAHEGWMWNTEHKKYKREGQGDSYREGHTWRQRERNENKWKHKWKETSSGTKLQCDREVMSQAVIFPKVSCDFSCYSKMSNFTTVTLTWSPASSVHGVVAEMRQIHTDYWDLWRKRDGTATLSGGERPDPCLDRLLLA